MSDLVREFEYYLENQAEFINQHNGKVLVIKDQKVIGVFDSVIEAVTETSKDHELGTFLVQACSPGDESHSQTFHSRVCFA